MEFDDIFDSRDGKKEIFWILVPTLKIITKRVYFVLLLILDLDINIYLNFICWLIAFFLFWFHMTCILFTDKFVYRQISICVFVYRCVACILCSLTWIYSISLSTCLFTIYLYLVGACYCFVVQNNLFKPVLSATNKIKNVIIYMLFHIF